MHKPPHPGEVLKDTVLRADGGITVTEFAKRLGVSRVALSRVDEKSPAYKRRAVTPWPICPRLAATCSHEEE